MNYKIVFVCHCEKHAPLYYVKNKVKIPVGKEAQYVDPNCNATWDAITPRSKDIVFAIHCPVYSCFRLDYKEFHEKGGYNNYWNCDIFLDILAHSRRVLKTGGSLFINTLKDEDCKKELNNAQIVLYFMKLQHKWDVTLTHSRDMPFYIKRGNDNLKGYILQFTKITKHK
jgi:hypothetical protein